MAEPKRSINTESQTQQSQDIQNKLKDVSDSANRAFNTAQDNFSDIAQKAQESFSEVAKKAQFNFKELKSKGRDLISRASDQMSKPENRTWYAVGAGVIVAGLTVFFVNRGRKGNLKSNIRDLTD